MKSFIPGTEGSAWAMVANMADRASVGNTQQQSLAPKPACSLSERAILQTETTQREPTETKQSRSASCLEDINDYCEDIRAQKYHSCSSQLTYSVHALQDPSQAARPSWHSHIPLSQHKPRGRKRDSELEFSPLLSPGSEGRWLPPMSGSWLGTRNISPVLDSLLDFVQIRVILNTFVWFLP